MLFSKFFSRLYKKANDEVSLEEQNDSIIMNAMQDVMDRKNPADRYVPPSGPLIESTTTYLNRKYPVGVPTKGISTDSLPSTESHPVTAINMGATGTYPEVPYLLRSMGGDPNDPKVRASLAQYWRMREEERHKQYYSQIPAGNRAGDWLFGGFRKIDDRNLPLLLPHFSNPRFFQTGSGAHALTRGKTPSLINFADADTVLDHPLGGRTSGYASESTASMMAGIPRRKGESDAEWIARALKSRTVTHELGHLLTFPEYVYSDADWVKWISPRLRSIGMQYSPHLTSHKNKGGYAFYTPSELSRAFAVLKMGMVSQGRQLPEHLSDLWRSKPDDKYLTTDDLGNKYIAFPELVAAQKEFERLDSQFAEIYKQQDAADAAKDTVRQRQLENQLKAHHRRWLAARSRFWELKDKGIRMAQAHYPQLQGLPSAVDDDEDFTYRLSNILDKAREYEEGVRNGTIKRNKETEELLEMLDSVYRSARSNQPSMKQQLRRSAPARPLQWAEPYVQNTAIG